MPLYGLVNRRAMVMTSTGTLTLKMRDTLLGTAPQLARPTWGGVQAALQFQPLPHHDEVLSLVEQSNWATTAVPAGTSTITTTTMQPGELGFLTPDGKQVTYFNIDGSVLLYKKPSGALLEVSIPGAVTLQAAPAQTWTAQGGTTNTVVLDGTGNSTVQAATGKTITLTAGSSGSVQVTSPLNVTQPATLQSSLSFPAPSPAAVLGSPGYPFSSVVLGSGSNGQRGTVTVTVGSTITPVPSTLPIATLSVAPLFGGIAPVVLVTLASAPPYPVVGVYALPTGSPGIVQLGLIVGPAQYAGLPNYATTPPLVTSVGAGTFNFWAASSSGASTTTNYSANFGLSSSSTSFSYVSFLPANTFPLAAGQTIRIAYWAVG